MEQPSKQHKHGSWKTFPFEMGCFLITLIYLFIGVIKIKLHVVNCIRSIFWYLLESISLCPPGTNSGENNKNNFSDNFFLQ